MDKVIGILMRRDGISREDATDLVKTTMEEVTEAIEQGDYDFAEELFMSDLGLEPDYMLLLM